MKDSIAQLVEVMAQLRGPNGCPWDKEQTHESIKPNLIEECYEVLEAIDSKNPEHLKEELGDLLLNVVFHARLSEEEGQFNLQDVAAGIVDKLIRRHPHVFGDVNVANSAEVLKNWNEIKKKEKPDRKSAIDGIPAHLPALMRAQELQKKAARVGFDWPDPTGPLAKVEEEIHELREAKNTSHEHLHEEFGDVLFTLVNLARHYGLDAEQCLTDANKKFIRRFQSVETQFAAQGKELKGSSLEEMDAAWNQAKAQERDF